MTSCQMKMSLVWHKCRVLPCHGMTTRMIIFIMRRNNNSAAVLGKVKIGATMRQQIEFPHQNRSRITADRNVPTLQWNKSLCSAPAVQIKSQRCCLVAEFWLENYSPSLCLCFAFILPSPMPNAHINKGILHKFLCRRSTLNRRNY